MRARTAQAERHAGRRGRDLVTSISLDTVSIRVPTTRNGFVRATIPRSAVPPPGARPDRRRSRRRPGLRLVRRQPGTVVTFTVIAFNDTVPQTDVDQVSWCTCSNQERRDGADKPVITRPAEDHDRAGAGGRPPRAAAAGVAAAQTSKRHTPLPRLWCKPHRGLRPSSTRGVTSALRREPVPRRAQSPLPPTHPLHRRPLGSSSSSRAARLS
jgi:hypothetical protein